MVSRWRLSVGSAVAGAIGLSFAACNAHVDSFSASSHAICAGQPVQLVWKVTGNATMTATPPLASLAGGQVASEGQMTVAPNASTEVLLQAKRWLGKTESAVQTIDVVTGQPRAEPLTVSLADASAGCEGGRVWATVHPLRFASAVKVSMVATHSGDGRTYDVQHGGARVTLTPGTTSATFAGQPIVGDWVLSSALLPGEACGTPALPRSLVVDVYAQCSPEGQP
jgi:hypothetical protein